MFDFHNSNTIIGLKSRQNIQIKESIENRQGSVMWYDGAKHWLSKLPKEMIHFESEANNSQLLVYELLNFLHCDYSRSSDLNFLFASTAQLDLIFNRLLQLFRVLKDLVLVEYLGHSVIREHCYLIDVCELSQTLPFVTTPNSCHQDLRPFVKENLVSFVNLMVLEVREVCCQYVQQLNSWFICLLDDLYKRSLKLMNRSWTDLSHQSRSLFGQWNFNPWEHLIDKLFLSHCCYFFEGYSRVDVLSDISCKLFIFEPFQGPKTEIARIEHKKILECGLVISIDFMMLVFIELFVVELLSNFLNFSLVYCDMLGLTNDKFWTLANKLALVLSLVWHSIISIRPTIL